MRRDKTAGWLCRALTQTGLLAANYRATDLLSYIGKQHGNIRTQVLAARKLR